MKFKQYLKEEELLEISIAHAATFAADAHQGQHRKGSGAPYIVHPRGVYKILRQLGVKDRELLVAAYLHDTIEDSPTTFNQIKKEFSKNTANLVKQVTSNKKTIDKVGKEQYLLDKMLKMSNNALTLKLADRLHNVSDIRTASKSFAEKIWLQTIFILKNLKKKRNLNTIQKKLVRLIEKELQLYREF